MTFGTILVHLDATERCATRIALAADMARAHGAHVVGIAPVANAHVPVGLGSRTTGAIAAQLRDAMHAEARTACARFDEQMRRGDTGGYGSRIAEGDPAGAVALSARYSDLVVLGQVDAAEPASRGDAEFVERVLLESGRPTLIVPYAGRFASCGRNVMVAWDAGRTAARAVTDALPVLKRADNVEVVVVNAHQTAGDHGGEPGADIALFLARHGVKVTVHQEVSAIDIGNTLLSRTADRGADLLVMGAYGHSRFRELILGGATRSVLSQMTIPVLMAH